MPRNVTSPSQGSRYFCSAYIAQAALWVKGIKFMEQISCDDAQTIQKSRDNMGEYSLGFTQVIGMASCYPSLFNPKFISWQFVFLCLIQKGNFFLPLCFTLRTTTTEMQIIGYKENKTPKWNNLSLPPFLLQTNKSALACMPVRQAEPFAGFFSLHTYSAPTPSMSQCSELHPGTLATTHTAQIQRQ